jgi:hypothetical protein
LPDNVVEGGNLLPVVATVVPVAGCVIVLSLLVRQPGREASGNQACLGL